VADQRLLLVLDNCEHLVRPAPLAEQLLRSGPQLRILASSREPLRVSGEASFPVPTLAVPASQDPVAVEALRQYPAVHLFVDRATAVLPTFGLTEHNAPAVAEICRRLDGIPLAIELAAARVRALSVENIAARLNDRFHLLTGGNRTALPRQQTLRALIDWSYDLLAEKERILFRRLAVFAGGWTLEAAEAVCSGAMSASAVLDLLAIVDKSVVTLDRSGPLRTAANDPAICAKRLNESGEDCCRMRHRVLSRARGDGPHFFGPDGDLGSNDSTSNARTSLRRTHGAIVPGVTLRAG
jgi:predicted ATPase